MLITKFRESGCDHPEALLGRSASQYGQVPRVPDKFIFLTLRPIAGGASLRAGRPLRL